MAAPTVRQIRQGAADLLDAVDGLRGYSTIPGQFSPPAAIVGMPTRQPMETFQRGTDRWDLTVYVVVARQADAQSEKTIEAFLNPAGSSSVRAAIYADKTLGGAVNDIFEQRAESVSFVFGSGSSEIRYLGLEIDYLILAPGKD